MIGLDTGSGHLQRRALRLWNSGHRSVEEWKLAMYSGYLSLPLVITGSVIVAACCIVCCLYRMCKK